MASQSGPACEERWRHLLQLDEGYKKIISKTWRIRPTYTSNRDMSAWFKLRHRTLHVAKHNTKHTDGTCMCCNTHLENHIHLMSCDKIQIEFWQPIVNFLMNKTNMHSPYHLYAFISLGIITKNKIVDNDRASMIAIAWRVLYATLTNARFSDPPHSPNLQEALTRVYVILHSRIRATAHSQMNQITTTGHTDTPKTINKKHLRRAFITYEESGKFTIITALTSRIKHRMHNSDHTHHHAHETSDSESLYSDSEED